MTALLDVARVALVVLGSGALVSAFLYALALIIERPRR